MRLQRPLIARDREISISRIQRRPGTGDNKAARLVEQMEDKGVVTRANNVCMPEILIEER